MPGEARFDRRGILTGSASLAGALAGPLTLGAAPAANAGTKRPPFDALRDGDTLLLQKVGRNAPLNLGRAYEVMEQLDLHGLVLGDPLNVFHATGSWPFLGRTRPFYPPTTVAILTRDQRQSPGLVTSKFLYYYTFADGVPEGAQRQVFLYTDGPEDPAEFYPDRGEAPLSDVEIKRRDRVAAALARQAVRVGVGNAVVDAMRTMGLWRGRIGFDRPEIQEICAHAEFPGQLVPGNAAMGEIRLIKSPLEIELMRRAAFANIDAIHAAASQIGPGATYRDLRSLFYAEAARRGNMPSMMTVDRVSNELADGTIRQGQALMIDVVSHFQCYHGDYGRTIFVGDPVSPMKRAITASSLCWSVMREIVKPGRRYSELVAAGAAALKKSGLATKVTFGTHSVGLMHHDQPSQAKYGVLVGNDVVLEENMTLSMECIATADTGVGGSAHYEDILLITRDGAEPIHPVPDPVIQV
jgi:Xaa-Pro aminopeptidase